MIFFIDLRYSLNRYPRATIKIVKSRLNYTEELVSATSMVHGGTPFKKVSLHAMKSRHSWTAGSISKTRPSIVTTSRNLLRIGKGTAKLVRCSEDAGSCTSNIEVDFYLSTSLTTTNDVKMKGLERNEIQFTTRLLPLCKSRSWFDDNSVAPFDLWRRMNVFA